MVSVDSALSLGGVGFQGTNCVRDLRHEKIEPGSLKGVVRWILSKRRLQSYSSV